MQKTVLEEIKSKYNLRPFKGYASIDLSHLMSNFFTTHGYLQMTRGIYLSMKDNWPEFKKECYDRFFLYKFTKDEINLVLSFVEDKGGVELDIDMIEPLYFKDYCVYVFNGLLNMYGIHRPIYEDDFRVRRYTDDEVIDILNRAFGDKYDLADVVNLKMQLMSIAEATEKAKEKNKNAGKK